jgi:inward rectifier potassium channel
MNKKVYRSTIPRDGSVAVHRIGVNPFSIYEIYHSLVTMSWPKFFIVLLLPFVVLAVFFTTLNAIVGFENFQGLTSSESAGKFLELLLYNAQTLTTIGGAGITPVGYTNNVILTIESMTAMLGAAVITGLLFVRFSKPSTGIIYSKNIVIAPHKNGNALMARIANAKKNEVAELTVTVFLITTHLKTNKRDVVTLDIERSYLPFLGTTFTIVHAISDQSPLKNFKWEDTDELQYELGVWISAIDRVTGQNVFAGHTWFMPEIVHDARFTPCMDVDDDGVALIYLSKVSDFERVESVR